MAVVDAVFKVAIEAMLKVTIEAVKKITSCVSSQTSEDLAKLEEAKTSLHEQMQCLMYRTPGFDAKGSKQLSSYEEREWLKKAEVREEKLDELIKTWARKNKSYRGGNFKKIVSEQLRLMHELIKELPDVREVAERRLSKGPVDRRPVEEEIVGQYRLFHEIIECFTEKQVGIIGLAGKGGVGKTTLLREISKNICDDSNKFDRVIWVNMSKDMRLGEIQDTIAKQIGLYDESWKQKEDVDAKAKDISTVLEGKKFALFLDDIWESIELQKVGVPLPGKDNAISKIVFTTCSSASCDKMGAHRTFKVECLKHEDAWKLFQRKVEEGTLRSHPIIHDLAEVLVQECHGLPLALKVVGVAMSAKMTLQEWNHVVLVSQRSTSDFQHIEERVLQALKISYDSLLGDTMRSCFLYCSLFSEDYSISKRDLIDYWIGEGLVKERSGARREGNNIVDHLVRACLLEEDDDGDHVKLHPVIRKMAVWITSEINRKEHFVVIADSREHEMEKWERAKRISITRSLFKDLCFTPTCPELLTLFINHTHLQVIGGEFFQTMPSLKVLNLSKNPYLAELPKEIASLASLEHLDLSSTNIEELPEEMKALENLKCLNLENTSKLHTIPRELVSSFSMLQVLRMLNCGSSEARKGSLLFDGGISLVGELLCLQRLELLSINLTSSGALDMFLESRELQRSTQSLCVRFLEFSKPLKLFVANMESLDTLSVSDCGDLEDLKIDCSGVLTKEVPLGFYSLKVVVISSCSKLKDLTWLIFALNLKRLEVSKCPNMQDIIDVGALSTFSEAVRNLVPFLMLEYLVLRQLPTLWSIHKERLPFPKLKEIQIVQCSKFERRQLAYMDEKLWNQLT